jgi:site-specific DNA recombinase
MPSTNGRGLMQAIVWVIIYARVSTDEQARSGYSLAQQLEALRAYCEREGYKILEEVVDPGQSGASLERPGMDRVRDLVAAGGVSVVLAQDRDRFAREPAYHYLLKREFEEHGTTIRALNDRGDGTPEGELTDGILDQLGKFERAKTAERTRRGKLRKAREGKIICGHTPGYGFRYNATRDGYEVEQQDMAVVKRIFEMVGSGGESIYGVCRALERAGVSSPKGNRVWPKPTVKDIIRDDAYRTLDYSQMQDLVVEGRLTADVLARLDRKKRHGIWWFNRAHKTERRVAVETPNGREYKTRSKTVARPRSEWIAVPVPDSGIPPELVDAARDAIKDNRSASRAGRRLFDLSGGVLFCSDCGRRMVGTSIRDPKTGKRYFYYECTRLRNADSRRCVAKVRRVRADALEPRIWGFVSGMILEPGRLRRGLETLIEEEERASRGDPDREAKLWHDKLIEAERMRSGYQDLAARGLLTYEELGEKLAVLEETRATARRELEALKGRRERLEDLKRDRDAVLEAYANVTAEALEELSPEERNKLYKMLKLRVVVGDDGTPEVSGVFCGDLELQDVGEISDTRNDVPAALSA